MPKHQPKPSHVKIPLIIALVLIVVGGAILYAQSNRYPLKYSFVSPRNFKECAEAGGAVMESFPERCAFKGQTFTNTAYPQNLNETPSPSNTGSGPSAQLKQYTSTQYKFSFKHPANGVVRTEPNRVTFNTAENEAILAQITSGKMWGEGYTYDIDINYHKDLQEMASADSAKASSLKEYLNLPQVSEPGSVKPITVAGQSAFRARVQGLDTYDVVFVENQGHIYEITFGNNTPEVITEKFKQDFLNNFTFLK
jgi:hypothetical protein